MTTLPQAYIPTLASIAFNKKRDILIEKLIPRRCMIISVGLILSGLSIPVLMEIQLLQLSLLLGFVGFALVAAGGVLLLIHCGEL